MVLIIVLNIVIVSESLSLMISTPLQDLPRISPSPTHRGFVLPSLSCWSLVFWCCNYFYRLLYYIDASSSTYTPWNSINFDLQEHLIQQITLHYPAFRCSADYRSPQNLSKKIDTGSGRHDRMKMMKSQSPSVTIHHHSTSPGVQGMLSDEMLGVSWGKLVKLCRLCRSMELPQKC